VGVLIPRSESRTAGGVVTSGPCQEVPGGLQTTRAEQVTKLRQTRRARQDLVSKYE